MRILFLIPLFFLGVSPALATVDFLAINHITKEYFWGDEDHDTGLIGWEIVPESGSPYRNPDYLHQQGYTETNFPYKLDLILGLILWGIGVALLRSYLKRKASARLEEHIGKLGKDEH